jgi:hypothetical protein
LPVTGGVRGNWDESAHVPPQELDADRILRTLLANEVQIVPAPDPANRHRLFAVLSQLDARPLEIGDFRPEEMPVPFTPEGLDAGGNCALATNAGRVDVMQWIPGIDGGYERLRANSVHDEVPGVGRLRVAGYEDLVAMKRTAGRPVDMADLDELARVREEPEA